jgi:cyclopropane-fatty-acyl-phospholipid synthase
MSGLIRIFRTVLNTLTHGPLYSIAQHSISSKIPLDPVENWTFWTKPRNPITEFVARNYPPDFVRRHILRAMLAQDHSVGIESHYDISNAFYKLFLDKEFMSYSCAYFLSERETLEDAQKNKTRLILDLLNPKAGEKILDLGCGWGGMLKCIYDVTGDRNNLSGYTLSKQQLAYIKSELGFNVSLTNFITVEYEEASYDKIFSIGAMEHVRPNEILRLLRKLYDALKPGGKLVQQFSSLDKEECPASMVLAQLFFPGSSLATHSFHLHAAEQAGFKITHDSVDDYKQTLRAWYENLVNNKEKAIDLVGVAIYNKYLSFFPISWRFFKEEEARLHRLVLEKV